MTSNSDSLPGWFKRPAEPDSDDTTDESELSSEPTTESSPELPVELPSEQTGSTTTTGGGSENEPVVVWEAANRMEAEIVRGRLESEDIPAIIQGEALGTIYGFTTGNLAATAVLVPSSLADKAIELLNTDVVWEETNDDLGPQSL